MGAESTKKWSKMGVEGGSKAPKLTPRAPQKPRLAKKAAPARKSGSFLEKIAPPRAPRGYRNRPKIDKKCTKSIFFWRWAPGPHFSWFWGGKWYQK